MTKQSNSRISELHAFDIFFQRHPLAILRSISHGHGRRLREYRYLVEQNLTPVDGTSNTRDADHMGGLQRVPRPSHAASCQDHSPLHQLERISRVRNRMWESRSSGSVGGEGGNRLAYPAISCCHRGRRTKLKIARSRSRVGFIACTYSISSSTQSRNDRGMVGSSAGCGWCVSAEPGVENPEDPDASAEVLGIGSGRGPEQDVVDHGLVIVGDVGDLCRY